MKLKQLFFILSALLLTTCEKEQPAPPDFSSKITVTNGEVGEITYRSAKVAGTLSDTYGQQVSDYGHCWDTLAAPTVDDSKSPFGTIKTGNSFSSMLEDLVPGKKYYVRSYFIYGESEVYGEERDFTTLQLEKPVIGTTEIVTVKTTSVTVRSGVSDAKGDSITERGFCYAIETNPTIETALIERDSISATGVFEISIDSLTPGEKYYLRAFATNAVGTSYGDEITFTTGIALPKVMTTDVSQITYFSAICGGKDIDTGGGTITQKGICWSKNAELSLENALGTSEAGGGTQDFSSQMEDLSYTQTYYVRAYVSNQAGTGYGEVKSFNTKAGLALMTTAAATDITTSSATSGGNITDDGGAMTTARGVCWNKTGSPSITDNKTNDGAGTGSFTSNLTSLSENTTYYVRAYATNETGTSYGDEVTFTTKDGIAVLTTTAVTDITVSSANSGGNITDDSGATITTRGVCWNTTGNPTTADSKTNEGAGTGSFTSNLTSLSENTTYYVRSYATNEVGTSYGDEISFTSKDGIAILTTVAATSITANSATSGCSITDDGGASITARGVCWNTTGNPTTTDSKTNDGAGTDSFSSNLTGLTENTTYYVRAYAINEVGTSYGEEVTFTTRDGIAVLTTATATSITANSATSGGNVIDDGGTTITARGVCWNTTGSPTTSDSKTNDGVGIGSFTSTLTGLSENTTYHVRAYATNETGTSYGEEVTFTTRDGIAVLTTTAATSITANSATSGGNVIDDGGTTITARGVCWNTAGSPTTIDNKTNDGAGTGSFTSSLTGLTESTTYYVRAYATNSYGTGYGQEISFVAKDYLTDYDGNIYETVKLGNQVWMAENLKVTKYPDGSSIPHVTDNTSWANLADNNADDAYCYYNNNSSSEYGALYTYAAALNACPAGWHLPSDAEWTELENYLADNGYNYDGTTGGGSDKIAKAMATASGWISSTTTGAVGNSDYPAKRNVSGFSALPGGSRVYYTGIFGNAGFYGYWWSSTEYSSAQAYTRDLYYNITDVIRYFDNKSKGNSVRCIRND